MVAEPLARLLVVTKLKSSYTALGILSRLPIPPFHATGCSYIPFYLGFI
jgi:hypothetical protein